MDTLKYPIGKFSFPETVSENELKVHMENIEKLPNLLIETLSGITKTDLNKKYQENSWDILQVLTH